MYLWILSNPDLTSQLLAGQNARSEATSRAGYLVITALERGLAYAGHALTGGFRGFKAAATLARRRYQAVNALRALDDRMLADIGVSRGEIDGLVDGTLERGPRSLAELRDLLRPVPQAVRRQASVHHLPKAA